jgi:signal peptidase II
MSTKVIKSLFISALILINIGCDQVSKTIVRQHISSYNDIRFVNKYVTLMKVENTGAFLSSGSTLPKPLKKIFLNVLPLVALFGGLYYLFTKKDMPHIMRFGLCCIIGGGIGNLYDRLLYGSVTDFLHIDFILFETGIFNMADVSIMTGMFTILIYMFLNKNKKQEDFNK